MNNSLEGREKMFNKNLSGKIVAGLLPILAVCCVVGLFAEKAFGASKADRPNVLVVITDQQSARMMSCAGNKYLKTPNMDFLASVGTRFERAYVTNPVCLPARFSFMTGRYPSVVGVRHNSQGHGAKNVPQYAKDALGNLLKKAGYRTVFGGKRHLPAEMGKIENCGFEVLTNDTRFVLAESCADFFQQEQEKPFLLMAMLINPHDICYQAIRSHSEWRKKIKKVPAPLAEAMKLPEGMSKEQFFAEVCPPLPANFEPMDLEPEAYSFL